MNYQIPEKEVENIISTYWQMLRTLESKLDSRKNNALDNILIIGAYNILNRCGITDHRPENELRINLDYPQNREQQR